MSSSFDKGGVAPNRAADASADGTPGNKWLRASVDTTLN